MGRKPSAPNGNPCGTLPGCRKYPKFGDFSSFDVNYQHVKFEADQNMSSGSTDTLKTIRFFNFRFF